MKKRTQSSSKGVSYVSRNFVKFCLLWIFSLSSLMIQAQDNQRISVDLRGESLESTLWYLQNRTKFIFMYATEDIANITDISVKAKNKTITEILDECLEGTNLTYEVSGTAIVIKKRKTNKITVLKMRENQKENRKLCGSCYCTDYLDYIYVNEIGEIIKPDYLTTHFKAFLEEHNMPHIRFHDLRHSCATLLFAQGVPMKEIQAWLGHSTIGTTANIYTHLDENSKINSANAIIGILEQKKDTQSI